MCRRREKEESLCITTTHETMFCVINIKKTELKYKLVISKVRSLTLRNSHERQPLPPCARDGQVKWVHYWIVTAQYWLII